MEKARLASEILELSSVESWIKKTIKGLEQSLKSLGLSREEGMIIK